MLLAKLYAHIYILFKNLFGVKLSGLGFILRLVKKPQYIGFLQQEMYFNPSAASSYGLHIIGSMQEPETHKFLNMAFDVVADRNSYFIEVGANIGVFMLDISRRSEVQVIGFEPSKPCVEAIQQTMIRNDRTNFHIFSQLVGEKKIFVPFDIGRHDGSASVYSSTYSPLYTEQIRLDDNDSISNICGDTPVVLMIDVEGYEPRVIMGGEAFIKRTNPLIIFEYNHVSKVHFKIADIEKLIGPSYKIFRLRKDGYLDDCVERAWNCVAVPLGSVFYNFTNQLYKPCME